MVKTTDFYNLPDRGSLVAWKKRKTFPDGAGIWELSFLPAATVEGQEYTFPLVGNFFSFPEDTVYAFLRRILPVVNVTLASMAVYNKYKEQDGNRNTGN